MCPTVSYNPSAADRVYLPSAGLYGPGQDNPADVVLFSVTLAEPGSLDAPFDDKNCEKDTYSVWTFRVAFDGKMTFVRSRAQANTLPNSGSKNLQWFANLGIEPTDTDDDGNPCYDLDKLSNIPCIIKMSKPRADKQDPSVMYSGSVVDVFGLGG